MKLGLDFDNTIVRYDTAFHHAACQRGLIPDSVPETKTAVREFLCAEGREDDWTELQGYVYGPGMSQAEPFPGLVDFLQQANDAGWSVSIISHRSKHPYRGPQHDLHAAAAGWLKQRGFNERCFINAECVFFLETVEDKVRQIEREEVAVFIDDLPKILSHKEFPAQSVRRVLFDPNLQHDASGFERLHRWQDAWDMLAPNATV